MGVLRCGRSSSDPTVATQLRLQKLHGVVVEELLQGSEFAGHGLAQQQRDGTVEKERGGGEGSEAEEEACVCACV
jgi:hypothetical protein